MRRLLLVISGIVLSSILFNAATPAALADGTENKITAEEVLAILRSMDTATMQRDCKGMTEHLSSDVVVIFNNILGPRGPGSRTFTRQEYVDFCEQGFGEAAYYKFERKRTEITLASDGGSARVVSTVVETMKGKSGVVRTTTEERMTFELRRGRIMIISMEGFLEIAETPRPLVL